MKITKKFLKDLAAEPEKTLEKLSTDDIASLMQKANHEYYNGDAPLMSDAVYDAVKDVMEARDPSHPILKSVGAVISSDDERKAKLPYFLASLDKIKTDPKVLEKWTEKYKGQCVVSDKLDGVSGLLKYKDGCVTLYTRGDGEVGQKITHLIPFIRGVPPLLMGDKEISVRGELIISKADFEAIKHKGANARNMVSGIVNAKIPDLEVAKRIQFVAYELIVPQVEPSSSFGIMQKHGFTTVYNETISTPTVESLSKVLLQRRSASPFEVDGIVVMHDKVYPRVKENPPYGFAFKSAAALDTVEVTVSHVEWNISKDGYYKPVVVFDGVQLAGVVIQRVTAFNGKYVYDNKLGPGSRITIIRSGDVIPYIASVNSPASNGEAQMPDSSWVWNDTRVDVMVSKETAGENNDVKFKNLEYFIKKIEVKGLASGTLRKMFDAGITTVYSVLNVTKEALLKVPTIKEKTATNILEALQLAKGNINCLKIMDASNAFGRGLGLKKLELIVAKYPASIDERRAPTIAELVTIKGVEKTTAQQFVTQLPVFWKFLDDNGLDCTLSTKEKDSQPKTQEEKKEKKTTTQHTTTKTHTTMTGMKVVFSGFRDSVLEKIVKDAGGDVTTSVSKNTTVVVTKGLDSSSSKVVKAKEIGVPVMTVDDFKQKYGVA